ncbi:hypothetical protein NDU88_005449 [Pleurodeles waltl]|uniref:Uncharacterized protein n=1 Tax=Pleurodeles waltl TaxID=8319 RepID=A0AAV7LU48_PLEWA|nr:hypothetical protein NDU88_005449 [Pleurodeles waltl]
MELPSCSVTELPRRQQDGEAVRVRGRADVSGLRSGINSSQRSGELRLSSHLYGSCWAATRGEERYGTSSQDTMK